MGNALMRTGSVCHGIASGLIDVCVLLGERGISSSRLRPVFCLLVSESESEELYCIVETLCKGHANLLMRSCTEAM
jgi:hypothetical protein